MTKNTKVETIKNQIESDSYDWDSAINDTAIKIADRKFVSFELAKDYTDTVEKRIKES